MLIEAIREIGCFLCVLIPRYQQSGKSQASKDFNGIFVVLQTEHVLDFYFVCDKKSGASPILPRIVEFLLTYFCLNEKHRNLLEN